MKKRIEKILKNLAKTYSKTELLTMIDTLLPDENVKTISRDKVYIGCYAFKNGYFADNCNAMPGLLGVVAGFKVADDRKIIIATLDEKYLSYKDGISYCKDVDLPAWDNAQGFMPDCQTWSGIFCNKTKTNFALRKANGKIISGGYWALTDGQHCTANVIRSDVQRVGFDSIFNQWKVRRFILV